MKLAMIGHKDFPSRSGGVEVVICELATRLSEKGYEVTVYNRGRKKGKNHLFYRGVEVIRAPTVKKEGFNALLYSITATFHALFKKYDLIHYHALGPSVTLVAARIFGISTVATVHGLDWKRAKWNRLASAYLKLGERIIAKYADEVIVLSQDVQNYFIKKYGRHTNLIKNAVVPVECSSCEKISQAFSIEKNSYVLFLARLVPEKGLHYLISAFKRCKTEKSLIIAGDLPQNEYGKKLLELAEGCDRIRFIGFVSGDILRELYSNCCLYVLPSEIEGLALSLLEAMSAGARCLVSDIPENTSVLNGFGATFHCSDEESLYRELSRLLSEPDKNPLADEQMIYIRKNYCYDAVIEKTEDVYRSAVNKAASR